MSQYNQCANHQGTTWNGGPAGPDSGFQQQQPTNQYGAHDGQSQRRVEPQLLETAGMHHGGLQLTSGVTNPSNPRGLTPEIPDWRGFHTPEEFLREPHGVSIIEEDAVLDEVSGRTYHGYKNGKYFLPNDPAEQDRLDLQHKGVTILLEGLLSWAPMTTKPRYVMDIATGTGVWAVEYAEQNPESIVIGTDLAAIQPLPPVPNCSFEKVDAEDEWLFGSTDDPIRFDYVHLRFVVSCFNDPKLVLKRAFDNMNPGGWIEYHDCISAFSSASSPNHRAEVVDIQEMQLIWPLGPWPDDDNLKLVGHFNLRAFYYGVRGMTWKLLELAGLSPDEIEALVLGAREDMCDQSIQPYVPFWVVFGRKPFPNETGP